ncbi:MAG TPA: SPFH domain-containing protein [Rhodopila sp.]
MTKHLPGRSPALDALLHQGAAGLAGAALLISLTGTLACILIARGRQRTLTKPFSGPSPVTRAAGWPQATLILAGMSSTILTLRAFPPLAADPAATVPGWSGLAVLILLPAFLTLVCERLIVAESPDRFPESVRLAALLRIPAFTLLLLAARAAAAGFGWTLGAWPAHLLALLLTAVTAELALRAISVWFLPLPAPESARAAIGSVLASLLQPGALRPTAMAQQMRARLGIDVTQSWAVAYVRAALPPVLLGLLVLAWGLTGVTRIGIAERGVYERFGDPVAVIPPGLHILLPWPFGRIRRVEFGVVHAVSIGSGPGGAKLVKDTSTADGPPPLSANRLWDEQSGTDSAYLIASRGAGQQSFETVSANIRVLYRIGLDDASARSALYDLVSPDTIVQSLADRLLARFFVDRTLDQVLGARREQVADNLRAALQAQLDARRSGVQVVAVIVESIRPPSGAAVAYRGVQAAQIIASTRSAEETGRAFGSLSVAARDAHNLNDQAQALAAELVGAARSDRWQADADTLAYRDGGRAFLLERYFGNLRGAFGHDAGLEIIDSRLDRSEAPMIDLRPPASAAGPNTMPTSQDYGQGNSDR